jgi:hypothetical protein
MKEETLRENHLSESTNAHKWTTIFFGQAFYILRPFWLKSELEDNNSLEIMSAVKIGAMSNIFYIKAQVKIWFLHFCPNSDKLRERRCPH